MFDQWNTAKTFKAGQFDIEVAWAYEDMPLRDCFDEDLFDLEDLQDRCERYVDTHYMVRVRALCDGVEMGADYLGSCYASDCDPADDIELGIDGYLEDMVSSVVSQAQEEAVKMLDRLKADFLS